MCTKQSTHEVAPAKSTHEVAATTKAPNKSLQQQTTPHKESCYRKPGAAIDPQAAGQLQGRKIPLEFNPTSRNKQTNKQQTPSLKHSPKSYAQLLSFPAFAGVKPLRLCLKSWIIMINTNLKGTNGRRSSFVINFAALSVHRTL